MLSLKLRGGNIFQRSAPECPADCHVACCSAVLIRTPPSSSLPRCRLFFPKSIPFFR